MKKVILVDGNNLLFRSYFATAYHGSILRNSKGFPTNALYGYINMINKIIREDKPNYMMVAFDKGKTFRHEKYKDYKGGRKATPDDLKEQFPAAKEITEAMGIPYFEIDNYEADDIIGTFAKEVDQDEDFIGTIVSSDKDLLQLISNDVDVKLLKSNDHIMMNKDTFYETYQITPEKMIDLKALMGDASDNIPGVKGIGEKTALNLLHEYKDLDGVYNNIDKIKGKTKEKLESDKENAYFSKELATIYKDVPIDTDLNKIKYTGPTEKYSKLLEEYEFYSLLNKIDEPIEKPIDVAIVDDIDKININDDYAIYIEVNGDYHDKDIVGIAFYNDKANYFLTKEGLHNSDIFTKYHKYTYDLKKLIVLFKYLNINYNYNFDDIMLSAYLLNIPLKDDITSLMAKKNVLASTYEKLLKDKVTDIKVIAENTMKKAKFIYDYQEELKKDLITNNYMDLYNRIDLPLSYVLADMEFTGVNISSDVLNKMKEDLEDKISKLEKEIYLDSGVEFNISSPKQLGKVLFETLNIPYPKKIKNDNYSTSADILNKIKGYPIVEKILEYRSLTKLYSNYAVGLLDCIKDDGKIHTTFNQTQTRTGRLSSNNPNLQNIPVREEYGRMFRKAFIPSADSVIISSDYSQIELRIFAHMSKADNLIEAFNKDMDIHSKTAMDIFHVDLKDVTPNMRRTAKAVNFGIIYGISSFGLSEDLGINVKQAKNFIDHYLETYPGIKTYMNELIKDAYEKGYVETLFGRKRILEELSSPSYIIRQQGERMALNTPIQGTSADILKKAMIEIYDKFNKLGLKSKMIIQVHDELIIDCKKDEQDKVIEIVKNIMENTCKLNVKLKADINVGDDWYEAK